MIKTLVPDYMSKFKCIGADCEDTCCSSEWSITIDKLTYESYKNLKDSPIKNKLLASIATQKSPINDYNYAHIDFNGKVFCPFMESDGLCCIQKELGEKHLSHTCQTFPRLSLKLDGDTEKSLILSCPEAARVVLLNKAGIGFIESFEETPALPALQGNYNSKDYPGFWDLRMFIISLIQNRQYPIETRLIVLGLFLDKLQQFKLEDHPKQIKRLKYEFTKRLHDLDYIQSLQSIKGNAKFQLYFMKEIIQFKTTSPSISLRYLSLLNEITSGLQLDKGETAVINYSESYLTYYEPFIHDHGYILENYFVNYIFQNMVPFESYSLFDSFMILTIHFNLIKMHLIGIAAKRGKLTVEIAIEIIQLITKNIEHDRTFIKYLTEVAIESGYSTMPHMFLLIKG